MFGKLFNSKQKTEDPKKIEGQPDAESTGIDSHKLKAIIDALNQSEAIFTRAGYSLEQLDVEFSNTPRLTPLFKQISTIERSLQDELLLETEGRQLIRFILISLFKSARMKSLFDNSELYYYGMEINISDLPSVKTIFKRKDPLAEIIPIKN